MLPNIMLRLSYYITKEYKFNVFLLVFNFFTRVFMMVKDQFVTYTIGTSLKYEYIT